jgi:hypothetical protein
MTVSITFSYDPAECTILHNWLSSIPRGQRSKVIRGALTAYLIDEDSGDSELDRVGLILESVGRIEDKICNGPYTAMAGGSDTDPLPSDIMANLRGLGE